MILTEKQRKIITKQNLKRFRKEGRTYKEIGKMIKVNPATVWHYAYKFGLTKHHNANA
jgi:DNA-binding CsgD family transcriptional regulator